MLIQKFTDIDIKKRIEALGELGTYLRLLKGDEFQSLADNVRSQNPWFREQNVRLAIDGIAEFLDKEKLQAWISNYRLPPKNKTVALIMAGNIPLVGFHDLLCVLIVGYKAMIKLSNKDSVLITHIIDRLIRIEPAFKEQILIVDRLKDFDAVIATGSDNSARYFDYYFGKYPNIIRKNRTSISILDGSETEEDLQLLGKDVFSYYGLGCRNVSKLFVPQDYNFDKLFKSWDSFNSIIHHHKYCNNYDYQKSILLVNRLAFLDNGFVLLQQSDKMVSPIAIVYYEYYQSAQSLQAKLEEHKEKIQCIVGHPPFATIPFGQAQCPTLFDYADNVDTLQFLTSLQS